MADQIGTTLSDMHSASSMVRDTSDELSGQLNVLHGQMDNILARWKGSAPLAFAQLQSQWHTDVSKLRTALAEMADMLDLHKTQYAQQDDAAKAVMTDIHAALGTGS